MAIELRNVAGMTEQILENDSPDAQICRESMRDGKLKCFKIPFILDPCIWCLNNMKPLHEKANSSTFILQ